MTVGGSGAFVGTLTEGGRAGTVMPRSGRAGRVRSAIVAIRAAASGGDVAVTCVVFSLLVAALCHGWALLAAVTFCLALAALAYPGGLLVLARRRTWILLAMIVASSTLVGPDPVAALGPFGVSVAGAVQGVDMIMRALIIIVAVTGLVSAVPIDRIGCLLERLGLRGLGFAVGVAFNLLPLIDRSVVTSWQALRLRAGLRRPVASARLMLVAVVTSCLRCADEVVLAAEARAFSPDGRGGPKLAYRQRVVPLAVALGLLAVGLALL